MSDINQVIVTGNLGDKAEIKELQGGTFAVNFSMGSTQKFKDRNNDSQERTTWFKIKLYTTARGASFFRDVLIKGAPVLVHGEILEDKVGKDAEAKYYRFIRAKTVKPFVIQSRNSSDDNGESSGSNQQQAPAQDGGVPASSVAAFDATDW